MHHSQPGSGQSRSCGAIKLARSDPVLTFWPEMAVNLEECQLSPLSTSFGKALTMGGDPHCTLPRVVIAITIVWPEGDAHYEQALA